MMTVTIFCGGDFNVHTRTITYIVQLNLYVLRDDANTRKFMYISEIML